MDYWFRTLVHPSVVLLLCMSACTMDNPAFVNDEQASADDSGTQGEPGETGGKEGGTDPGDGDPGDGDPGDGDGDPGDGDPGDGDPGDGDPGDGDPNISPCEGLGYEQCAQTNGCEPLIYQPVEQLPNDAPCLGAHVYEGCIPIEECEPATDPYWCNANTFTFIIVEVNSCLPLIVEQEALMACPAMGLDPLPCPP